MNSHDNNFALYFNCDRATGSDAAMTYYWQGGGATGGDAIFSAGGGWYDGVISNDPPEQTRNRGTSGNDTAEQDMYYKGGTLRTPFRACELGIICRRQTWVLSKQ